MGEMGEEFVDEQFLVDGDALVLHCFRQPMIPMGNGGFAHEGDRVDSAVLDRNSVRLTEIRE